MMGDCLAVDLSDGNGFFTGVVRDISLNGMRLVDVSKKINVRSGRLTVVMSAGGKNFKMTTKPKWYSEKVQGKSIGIGVEILNVPPGWTEFVMKNEPQSRDVDVWSKVSVRN